MTTDGTQNWQGLPRCDDMKLCVIVSSFEQSCFSEPHGTVDFQRANSHFAVTWELGKDRQKTEARQIVLPGLN